MSPVELGMRRAMREQLLGLPIDVAQVDEIVDLAFHAAQEGVGKVLAVADTARTPGASVAVLGPAFSLLRWLVEEKLGQLEHMAKELGLQSHSVVVKIEA